MGQVDIDGVVSPPYPSGTPTKIVEQQPGPWEPTSQTEEVSENNPDVAPTLPQSPQGFEYQWQKQLAPKNKQHKKGLPNIGLGPFDAPVMEWRLHQRELYPFITKSGQ